MKQRIFFIGDLHLDHRNIIKYCNRPFNDVEEMNTTLIDNWNKAIKKNDIVYFLGDLAHCKGEKNRSYWLSKLNGEIILIDGNHDKIKSIKYKIFAYKGYKFLITHYPEQLPIKWNGWVIHGHKHNNDIENFPLINKEKKTINVSVELIDYKPIFVDEIIKKMRSCA